MSEKHTKKKNKRVPRAAEKRDEYDFSGGVRGRYAGHVRSDVKMVVLDPDVARAFTTPKAVNHALRAYLTQRRDKKRRRGAVKVRRTTPMDRS